MKLKSYPEQSLLVAPQQFSALHPMFRYEVAETPLAVKEKMAAHDQIVVVGMGGSILPLKAFTDFLDLKDRVFYLDTVDPLRFRDILRLSNPLFCIASKSGETLEIKALLAEIIQSNFLSKTVIATDPEKGFLREFTNANKLPNVSIPSELGGRFTNFSPLHRAILERFGVDFNAALARAKATAAHLKQDATPLERLFKDLFNNECHSLILLGYGDRMRGICEWIQQAVAESLGKRTQDGKRVGVLPTVLSGPQDQHSVLQLLMDGPQERTLWFLSVQDSKVPPVLRKLEEKFKEFTSIGLRDVLDVLKEATLRSFVERLSSPETGQPVHSFECEANFSDLVDVVVIIQAFIEYAGERLKINAFDQPGVERGKQISRELIRMRVQP